VWCCSFERADAALKRTNEPNELIYTHGESEMVLGLKGLRMEEEIVVLGSI
jgi:hypothetical protein